MFPDFLTEPVDKVAQKLLGCFLERTLNGKKILVRIVETEAYDQQDEASHTFRGKTPRNHVMFGQSGHLYVYFTYGMHYCCNVVTGDEHYGSGVLIRAVEPIEGIEIIKKRRGEIIKEHNLTNGPGNLCKALDIDKQLNGHDLHIKPLRLLYGELFSEETITQTTRVGISKAQEKLRRYYITNNKYISRN